MRSHETNPNFPRPDAKSHKALAHSNPFQPILPRQTTARTCGRSRNVTARQRSAVDRLPIVDGHNDTLLHLYARERGGGRSFFARSDVGHIDLPRAREGGLAGGFFAIFVPSNPPMSRQSDVHLTGDGYEVRLAPRVDHSRARQMTIEVASVLFQLEEESNEQLKVVRTAGELTACLLGGVLGVILHLEGAEAIDPRLEALQAFYKAGMRSLGIVWSRPNAFGTGVPFRFPHSPDTGPGLTDAG
ncbi:MAG: membrane dipeptidase, partial [Chloroflexi bacterium]|nr:membrane dipeptidase [Chloroflexota bacterium]